MEKSPSTLPLSPLIPTPLSPNLLEDLWRSNDHRHFLAVRDPVSGSFQSVHISGLDQVGNTVSKFDLAGRDVYHACACFHDEAGGRKAQNAIGAYGFWVDIDCGPAKAESGKGYADEEQADLALTAFCNDNDVPLANWIVHSGGGVHAYWIVDELVQKDEWRDHAIKLKALPDSTMSRGIVFNMRRKLASEKVQRMRSAEAGLFDRLSSKLVRFAIDYRDQVRDARPGLPDALSDRSQDNWEPLLAIAECAGEEWVRRATDAALKMSVSSEAMGSASNDLLADIREVLNGWTSSTIKSVELIEKLCEDPEMGWSTYNRGRELTPRQLSKYLSVYNLKPRTVRKKDGSTPKGYYLDEFQEIFLRYLKPQDGG